jgi:methylated-DNA-[protein]-cysteine S-methyltransferase
MLKTTIYPSPLGAIHLTYSPERGLSGVYFEGQRHWPTDSATWQQEDGACFAEARSWLDAYFAKEPLPPLPRIHLNRGTEFQQKVWRALLNIQAGETMTYGQLATSLGAAKAVRAVGAAVGRNPLSLMVPCHRVIGSTGSLTGYAGGLDRKRWLLAHEHALRDELPL